MGKYEMKRRRFFSVLDLISYLWSQVKFIWSECGIAFPYILHFTDLPTVTCFNINRYKHKKFISYVSTQPDIYGKLVLPISSVVWRPIYSTGPSRELSVSKTRQCKLLMLLLVQLLAWSPNAEVCVCMKTCIYIHLCASAYIYICTYACKCASSVHLAHINFTTRNLSSSGTYFGRKPDQVWCI